MWLGAIIALFTYNEQIKETRLRKKDRNKETKE
jgi:hypothetical protein